MRRKRLRRRFRLLAAVAVPLTVCLGALAARPFVARHVRARIEAEAGRRGLTARMDDVRVGLWPPLLLTSVVLEIAGSWRLKADAVEVWWPGRTHLIVRDALLQGPAGLTAAAGSTGWDIDGLARDDLSLTLTEPPGLLVRRTVRADGSTWTVEANDLTLGSLIDVRRSNRRLFDGGTVRGSLTLRTSGEVVDFDVDLSARSARLPALAGDGSEPPALGEPTRLSVQAEGAWRRPEGALDVPRWSATIEGASLSGSLELRDLDGDPSVDLTLAAERVDFARLLRTAGLAAPETLGPAPARLSDLGSASLSARAQGRFSDPASFVVTQRLEFKPPQPMPPAIERLRKDFVRQVILQSGASREIDISPTSPDFIPLPDVPPLLLRALLLAEDAGFYNHPGIDLREVPNAVLTDWAKGRAVRGASTITQQLAKNLFLSHDRRLGRKLQELSLTLLLESALGKARILEVYLNVIEWGPDLYGLRPAARVYFDREPRDLTPAQMAFLISLIPGPVKYQISFADGTPGPGLRQIIDALLAKLRSVDALTEEEYQRALDEEIVVHGREAPTPAAGGMDERRPLTSGGHATGPAVSPPTGTDRALRRSRQA